MNISKKIIAITAVCAALGVGITAYASQPSAEKITDLPAESTVSVEESTPIEEETAPVEEETASAEEEASEADEGSTPAEEETVIMNEPSEGDEIKNDKYFVHTYSNGKRALIPFITDTNFDVEAFKKLGSDTPYKDEICYIVYETLDGTRRYFRLGESPDEILGIDMLKYGICSYIEGGIGEYYEEAVEGGFICGWR